MNTQENEKVLELVAKRGCSPAAAKLQISHARAALLSLGLNPDAVEVSLSEALKNVPTPKVVEPPKEPAAE